MKEHVAIVVAEDTYLDRYSTQIRRSELFEIGKCLAKLRILFQFLECFDDLLVYILTYESCTMANTSSIFAKSSCKYRRQWSATALQPINH